MEQLKARWMLYKSKTVVKHSERYLCGLLLDENQPISERARALTIADLFRGHHVAREALTKVMQDPTTYSIYLAQFAADGLGAMKDTESIPALEGLLCNLSVHPILRLKATEALAAFNCETPLNNSLLWDPNLQVRETCLMSLLRITETKNAQPGIYYQFYDPTTIHIAPVAELRDTLLNEGSVLYARCSALFGLRELLGFQLLKAIENPAAHQTFADEDGTLSVIIEALGCVQSVLLRYHIVNVLRTCTRRCAYDALAKVIRNCTESPLVRYKASEALYAIADLEGRSSGTYRECVMLLREFLRDPESIVSQSCEVALRRLDFVGPGPHFEFYVAEKHEDTIGEPPYRWKPARQNIGNLAKSALMVSGTIAVFGGVVFGVKNRVKV